MVTFQEFDDLRNGTEGIGAAISRVIDDWKSGDLYKTAILADSYDKQRNDTIMTYVQKIFSLSGSKVEDFTASNNKIASNFFRRLNVQRNTYSLGNGVNFEKEGIKERFGAKFDTRMIRAGYLALIHGVCFPFWNDEMRIFEATEFAPLYDEETGVLTAGIRFWQIDEKKPMFAVLYEKNGYTKYRKKEGDFVEVQPLRTYRFSASYTAVDGVEIADEHNYSVLPIVPLWGSNLKQSTLVGLRSQIDSYDLIRSGFANDLTDVSQIYWIVENFGGMRDEDLARFRDRLKLNHIATADTSDGGKVTPYSQDIPFQARETYLASIRQSIFDDFGAFDVRGFSAGAKTATEIDAAYQPLDENADDFEAQIIEFLQNFGRIIGIAEEDSIPIFKRNRIANTTEAMQALAVADWLDTETKIRHTPIISVDEQEEVLNRIAQEALEMMSMQQNAPDLPQNEPQGEGEVNE